MTVIHARYLWLAILFIIIKPIFVSCEHHRVHRSIQPKNSTDPLTFLHHNIYEKKDSIVQRLNHIATTLSDLKTHLTHQQLEFVEPIKAKVSFLKKILDVFQLFNTGAAINKNASIIASSVQVNQNNIVGKIQLNAEINSIKDIVQKLRATNVNVRSQIDVQHQIRKRSFTETTEWTGNQLHVNKLTLLDRQIIGKESVKPINKQNSVHNLRGKLKINRLVIKKLMRPQDETINGKRTKRSTMPSLDYPNIVVKSINEIDFNEFINTAFRKGINTVINGNLIFGNSVNVNDLVIDETVNGILMTDLMTTTLDQIVQTNIYIEQIIVDADCNVQIFNEMKHFAKNVVLLGRDNVIKSRITIPVCTVASQLKLSDDEGDSMTEHIVGTHMDDLTQIYNGKVRIKGSADVKNIFMSQDNPAIENHVHVNGVKFELMNVSQQYWMKQINQDLKKTTFNKPIISSQATIARLNGTTVDTYFSVLNDATNLPIDVDISAPVIIKGNLFSDQTAATTTLQKLSSESVARLGGSQVTLDSPIIFKGRLLANHMEVQLDTSNLVLKSANGLDNGNGIRKQFERLTISGNIIMPSNMTINIQNFNEYFLLKNYLGAAITALDKSAELTPELAVIFEKACTAKAIDIQNAKFFETIQNNSQSYDINAILQDVQNVRKHRIQILSIDGFVQFNHDQEQNTSVNDFKHISILNGLEFSKYLQSIILIPVENKENKPQKSVEIGGEKAFISELNIKSAHTLEINKRIQTSSWFEDAYRQQRTETVKQQQITAPGWQICDLTSDNFDIQNAINDIQILPSNDDKITKHIIFVDDKSSNTLTIVSDVSISNEVKIGSSSKLTSTELRPCNVLPLIPTTVYLTQRYWYEINVIGNVKIVDKELKKQRCSTPFCYFQTALTSETEESINTNIVFNLVDRYGKFSFNQIIMSSNGQSDNETALINNINPLDIFRDAVTRTALLSDTITFNAQKNLIGTEIIFSVTDALSTNNFNVNLINDINMNYLNRTLYLRSTTREMIVFDWQKFLFLNAPVVRKMTLLNQTINGIDVSTILFAYTNQSSVLSFQKQFNEFTSKFSVPFISSETINVNLVNGISFEYFIENRCRLSYQTNKPQTIEGQYTFENLILIGNETLVDQINDVPCDEMVLKQSKEKQLITGAKQIDGDYSQLFIEKPFHIWKTNDYEFVAIFAKSILLNHKQTIERIQVQNPYQVNAQKAYVLH